MILDYLKYKKTNFNGGDLFDEKIPRGDIGLIKVPEQFISPLRIDSRDMCLSSSDQGDTPNCAGYSVAGYIEYHNWKTIHYPAQVNGDAIYFEAKKIDGNNNAGTYLSSAIKAAINLKLINGSARYVDYPSVNQFNMDVAIKRIVSIKFALHEYGVVLAGFRITDEWNWVDKKTGLIRNFGNKAKDNGGHAVLLCGYDRNGVYIQNSWGSSYGHYGFAILSWNQYVKQIMQAMVIDVANVKSFY
jgi:hypothetical protein